MKNIFLILVVIFLIIGGCTPAPEKEPAEERKVYISYTDWAESVALTKLSAILLEKHLGYEVTLKLTGIDTVFHELATGRADVFVDVWVPQTHQEYLERYRDDMEDLGPNYQTARTGLVVPDYMAVESIPGLREYYTGPIAGIDTAAGIMRNTIQAMQVYDLENELLVLSDPEMASRLQNAIRRREPIVVTGWEPHWLFHRYDLRYLEDPLDVFLEVEQIHTFSRKGFSENHPAATTFFRRMVLSEKQINEILYEVHRHNEPREGVMSWIRKNEFTVNRWVRGLAPDREKIM